MDNIDSEFSFRKMIKQIFNRLEEFVSEYCYFKKWIR